MGINGRISIRIREKKKISTRANKHSFCGFLLNPCSYSHCDSSFLYCNFPFHYSQAFDMDLMELKLHLLGLRFLLKPFFYDFLLFLKSLAFLDICAIRFFKTLLVYHLNSLNRIQKGIQIKFKFKL